MKSFVHINLLLPSLKGGIAQVCYVVFLCNKSVISLRIVHPEDDGMVKDDNNKDEKS